MRTPISNMLLTAFAILFACLARGETLPAPFDSELASIQQQWAIANYQTPERDARRRALESLSERAHSLSTQHPQRAEALIWEGIVLSTYAGARGGLSALGAAKKARAVLERALKIDSDALDGSAYTSLGALYAKVPGFPIGFGNEDKASELLRKALALNPDGIDPNYFYAELLCDHGRCAEAAPYLEKARNAAPRPGRELADLGRHREIDALLAKSQD